MFRALCAHHQEVKIVLYSIWYHHTCRWPSRAQVPCVGMNVSAQGVASVFAVDKFVQVLYHSGDG